MISCGMHNGSHFGVIVIGLDIRVSVFEILLETFTMSLDFFMKGQMFLYNYHSMNFFQ